MGYSGSYNVKGIKKVKKSGFEKSNLSNSSIDTNHVMKNIIGLESQEMSLPCSKICNIPLSEKFNELDSVGSDSSVGEIGITFPWSEKKNKSYCSESQEDTLQILKLPFPTVESDESNDLKSLYKIAHEQN